MPHSDVRIKHKGVDFSNQSHISSSQALHGSSNKKKYDYLSEMRRFREQQEQKYLEKDSMSGLSPSTRRQKNANERIVN